MTLGIATGLALIALSASAPMAVAAERVSTTTPPIIVCNDPADCGPPVCLLAQKRVSVQKAFLHEARANGTPNQVRKAKQRLARAKRERRNDC